MAEASLSFLGFGLPINIPSWGGLLSREGRQYMEMAPWLALFPGLALTITVYSFNMFGDALRDLLDPRLKRRRGQLRHCEDETQKGIPVPADQPFQRVSAPKEPVPFSFLRTPKISRRPIHDQC